MLEMNTELWEKIEEIFGIIIESPIDQRQNLLDEACLGNEELKQVIVSLLSSREAADKFFEKPFVELLKKYQEKLDADENFAGPIDPSSIKYR